MRKIAIVGLAVAAIAIRLAYLWRVGGIVHGVDSAEYIAWARSFAGMAAPPSTGGGRADFAFHQLYPAVLSPMFWFGLPEQVYVILLHVALSTATVLLMFMAGRELGGFAHALLVGAVTAVYPSLLLWLPYLLSETLFFFCLGLFVLMFLRALTTTTSGRVLAFVCACGLMLFARPVAIVLVATASTILLWRILMRRLRATTAAAGITVGWLAAATVAVTVLATNPALYARFMYNPTIAQSLWLGTHLSTTDLPTVNKVMAAASRLSWPERAEGGRHAIASDPAAYASMCVRRFVAFWFPSLFASTWSRVHRLVDALLATSLIGLTLFGFGRVAPERRMPAVAVALLAISLALLSAFTQIEPDGRYRVPAELLLLLTAPFAMTLPVFRLPDWASAP